MDKFDITVVETALTADELAKQPQWLKRYILNKGKKIINNRGIDYFSMTLEFSNVVEVAGSKTVQVNISPRYMKS
ncbi:MAG: hypothetical protein IJD36_02980, partial [Clostridia bacterium]|nr:hypothetical protein [Clostridia bacterium]